VSAGGDGRGPGPPWLRVEPSRINLATHGLNSSLRPDDVREALLDPSPDLVLDGDWDSKEWGTSLVPVESMDIYEAMRDVLVGGGEWQDTRFFKRVRRQIVEEGSPRWGCHTEADLLERLNTDIPRLYAAIRDQGYRTQVELGSETPQDEIRVGIRRDGRFVLFDGRHRLILARLLGLDEVPVNVVVRHREWVEFKREIRAYADKTLRGRVYQALDHPDLADIPAKHGPERLVLIREALAGRETEGRTLLDIGTHWGYMAQQMEKLGFECTGLELNADAVRFATKLRAATESKFEIWEGDLLDYPGGRFDVVLALSIFHHMIKTRKRFEKLKEMLARLSPELMIFEPHDKESAAQMEGAYRDFAPEEFASFVAENVGLPKIEYIGTPADRYERPIFRLSR
jgi:2-polyprenyl-3-methyl-5-hydroxy-6-metoxy-1,4-benzoquinol methylase